MSWTQRSRWAAGLALVVAGGLLAWYALDADSSTTAADATTVAKPGRDGLAAAAAVAASGASSAGAGPFSATGLAARQQQLALWQKRYERAEQVYSSYRDATRYPHESRPLSEHADQQRPFDPVAEDKALRDASGKVAKGVRLRTTQERVFLGGLESVKFTISAVNDKGEPVALQVNRSSAQSVPDTTALIAVVSAEVPFSDDGAGPDAVASDGIYSARLTPSAQGFASHAGTIRLLAQVTANGEQGVAHFDVVYEPTVPATWASGAREAVEAGSLNIYLKARVLVGGRYVVSGRLFDANGAPFALVQFNDTVAAGPAEFKLHVFGALIRDKAPAFPLRLVDVDGFLLRPDTFPDRAMMARLPGVVHTSQRYSPDNFSPTEWSSEERNRYLAEYGKDVQEALDQIGRLK